MPVMGAGVVSKNILVFTKGFLKQVDRDMDNVRRLLDKQVEKNTSLDDHSLSDLRAMGHPYARRAPQEIHTPPFQVHAQSGKLKRARYSGTEKAAVMSGRLSARAFVGINSSVSYALNVVLGTSKMVPRDFLVGSLGEVREKAFMTLKRSLNKAVVTFNGEKRLL